MHELGIARTLWTTIQQKAREKKLEKITFIKISLGAASGIDQHFLEHSFVGHIFPGTIAEYAKLEFIPEAPTLICNNCQKIISSDELTSNLCPFCGSFDLAVKSGKDVVILEVE